MGGRGWNGPAFDARVVGRQAIAGWRWVPLCFRRNTKTVGLDLDLAGLRTAAMKGWSLSFGSANGAPYASLWQRHRSGTAARQGLKARSIILRPQLGVR